MFLRQYKVLRFSVENLNNIEMFVPYANAYSIYSN